MHKQTLEQLEAEIREIIRLEGQFIKYSLLILGDVISHKELAAKGIPRAEVMDVIFKLAIECNRV
jgi:hypothetical protein